MQQIKIFRKFMESADGDSFKKVEKTVNKWLTENSQYSIKNIFSANMVDDEGDGDLVLIVVYSEEENISFG